jgi:hypothetical protein
MNTQDLNNLDVIICNKIMADRKKKEAETKAFFDGMEEGAEMMRKAVRDFLNNEEEKEGADNG